MNISFSIFNFQLCIFLLSLVLNLFSVSNIALNKPVFISSPTSQRSAALNVVDGNLESLWQNCAVTLDSPILPWLLVDLLSEYHILYVRLKNRKYADLERSQPFDVRVGNNNQNGGISNDFCVQQGRIPTQNTVMRFDCPQGTRGRYISFLPTANQSRVDLCELEAYGVKG